MQNTFSSDTGYKWTVKPSGYGDGHWIVEVTPPNGRSEYVETYCTKTDAVGVAKYMRSRAEKCGL